MDTVGKQFFTPQELVEHWGGRVSVFTLANWRSQGVGPKFVKISGRIAYRLAHILEWEDRRTVGATGNYRRD